MTVVHLRFKFLSGPLSAGSVRAASGSEQCKGENENQCITSVGRRRAGRTQRGDGVMNDSDFVFFDGLDEGALKLLQKSFVLLF
jgi:hypothetical protein